MTNGVRVGSAPVAPWRNRIVGAGEESPADLVANPKNWWLRPKSQQDALPIWLDHVGSVEQMLVNCTTGRIVDGYLRTDAVPDDVLIPGAAAGS